MRQNFKQESHKKNNKKATNFWEEHVIMCERVFVLIPNFCEQ